MTHLQEVISMLLQSRARSKLLARPTAYGVRGSQRIATGALTRPARQSLPHSRHLSPIRRRV